MWARELEQGLPFSSKFGGGNDDSILGEVFAFEEGDNWTGFSAAGEATEVHKINRARGGSNVACLIKSKNGFAAFGGMGGVDLSYDAIESVLHVGNEVLSAFWLGGV